MKWWRIGYTKVGRRKEGEPDFKKKKDHTKRGKQKDET